MLNFVLKPGPEGPEGPTGNGIASVVKTGTSGLVDTYTITFTNGNTTIFTVTNGNGIVSIAKTATVDNVDTYTITFTDGTTTTFDVTNSEVTEEQLNEVKDKVNKVSSLMEDLEEEGTSIHTTESADWYGELGVEGFSRQETTTGANILNNTIYSLGTISMEDGSNLNSSDTYRFDEYMPVDSNTAIYLLKHLCVYYYDENKNYISYDITGNLTLTTPENAKFARFRTFGGDFSTFNNEDYMVSYSAITSYEPYTNGASPNPSYPQKIRNLEGKNKYNKYGDFNYPTTQYTNGTTLLSDGTIKTTTNLVIQRSRGIQLTNMEANTDYIVSGKLLSSTGTGSVYGIAGIAAMGYTNSWSQIAAKSLSSVGSFSLKFNTGEATDFFISLNVIGAIGSNYEAIFDEIMISKEGGEYAPYNTLRFKKQNKNLLKNTMLLEPVIKGGVTVTPNEDGTFTLNGASTSSSYFDFAYFVTTALSLDNIDNTTKSATSNNFTLSATITNGSVKVGNNTGTNVWYINTKSSVNYNNAILKIQLEKRNNSYPIHPTPRRNNRLPTTRRTKTIRRKLSCR